jgi:hypothetical protein
MFSFGTCEIALSRRNAVHNGPAEHNRTLNVEAGLVAANHKRRPFRQSRASWSRRGQVIRRDGREALVSRRRRTGRLEDSSKRRRMLLSMNAIAREPGPARLLGHACSRLAAAGRRLLHPGDAQAEPLEAGGTCRATASLRPRPTFGPKRSSRVGRRRDRYARNAIVSRQGSGRVLSLWDQPTSQLCSGDNPLAAIEARWPGRPRSLSPRMRDLSIQWRQGRRSAV